MNKKNINKFSKSYETGLNKLYDFEPETMEKHITNNTDLKICEYVIREFQKYGDCKNEVLELEQIKKKIKKFVNADSLEYNLKQASTKFMYHYLREKYDQK